jgi:hypothetical protein
MQQLPQPLAAAAGGVGDSRGGCERHIGADARQASKASLPAPFHPGGKDQVQCIGQGTGKETAERDKEEEEKDTAVTEKTLVYDAAGTERTLAFNGMAGSKGGGTNGGEGSGGAEVRGGGAAAAGSASAYSPAPDWLVRLATGVFSTVLYMCAYVCTNAHGLCVCVCVCVCVCIMYMAHVYDIVWPHSARLCIQRATTLS